MHAPNILLELADIVGEKATLQLVQAYGGTTITLLAFADNPREGTVQALIGNEAYDELLKVYAVGDKIYIAACYAQMIAKRDAEIIKQYLAGVSVAALARTYKLSDRRIWDILKKDLPPAEQPSLF